MRCAWYMYDICWHGCSLYGKKEVKNTLLPLEFEIWGSCGWEFNKILRES